MQNFGIRTNNSWIISRFAGDLGRPNDVTVMIAMGYMIFINGSLYDEMPSR